MNRDDIFRHLFQVFDRDMYFCGCGDPEPAYDLVRELLTLMPLHDAGNKLDARRRIPDDGVWHIVLSVMTHAGLIEHGGSVNGSWITDKGRWLLWAMNQVGDREDWSEEMNEFGIPHYPMACTADCFVIPKE